MTEKFDLHYSGSAGDAIEALFADARASQPELRDDNFSKIVNNSLPAKPMRRRRRGMSFDAIGMLLGFVGAYLFFDVGGLVSKLVNLVPESFTLSPVDVFFYAVALVTAMSAFAWWAVENNRG